MPDTFTAGYESKVIIDWTIPQGADTQVAVRPFTLTDPADPASVRIYTDYSTGWSARAQIRRKPAKSNTEEPWVAFTSAAVTGPRITLGADGWIRVVLPAASTEGEPWNSYGRGAWDLETIDPSGVVTREVMGDVTVSHDVTRTVTA